MPFASLDMIRKILVVCTGNVCRSPMAQGLLKHTVSQICSNETHELMVKSCGLTALVGQPAVESAINVMQQKGIDITDHRAQQIDEKHINWADLILVMEEMHREVIHARVPSSRGKVFKLGHFSDIDIPDPYRQPKDKFVEVLDMIDEGVSEWVRERIRSEGTTS